MAGYIGFSRSVNSKLAIEDYEMPISQISKDRICDFLVDFENEYSEDDIKMLDTTSVALWRYVAAEKVRPFSWHHTSKFYNKTNHYSLLTIADYLLENIDTILEDYKRFRNANKPSKEDLDKRQIKKQIKIDQEEKAKLFKYQSQYKSLSGFLRSKSVNIESLKEIRLAKIAKRREELRQQWSAQQCDNLSLIDNDSFIESYIR